MQRTSIIALVLGGLAIAIGTFGNSLAVAQQVCNTIQLAKDRPPQQVGSTESEDDPVRWKPPAQEEPVHPGRLQEASAQRASAGAEESRWGALAFGGNGFGATRGRPDENSAAEGALRQCEESGGAGECQIRLTYRNRCAAYAAGDNRETGIAYASSIEEASKLAQRSCSEATGNCRLQYAACSLPSSFN